MSLPESIKNMRMKTLLSQEELADILHVSVGTINRWENGKTKPNISAMKAIRSFCADNNYAYENIESEWIKDKENHNG